MSSEMEKLLSVLEAKSVYSRKEFPDGRGILRLNYDYFIIRRITEPEDPALIQAQNLFERAFGDETDYFPLVRGWVTDRTIAYHAILNAGGEVIAASNSSYLTLEPEENVPQSMLAVWFMAVDEKYRGRRLANELYWDMYRFALDLSLAEKKNLKAIVGEAHHSELETIEHVLNREEIGRKRVYYENKAGNISEAPYFSVSVGWNHVERTVEQNIAPNHLMLRLLDGRQSIQAGELLQIIGKIYDDCYLPKKEDFPDEKAFREAQSIVESHLEKIKAGLAEAKNNEVFLMSLAERRQRLGET